MIDPESRNRLARQALSDDPYTAAEATHALFREVVEPMADAFDPALCLEYARLFAPVIAEIAAAWPVDRVFSRYERVRRPRRYGGSGRDVRDVTVLSRVTLGADVAVTSVLLDAAKKRFPGARIHFAGPGKNFEMFAADRRIRHTDVPYLRTGSLAERLTAGLQLGDLLRRRGGIVLDPDSRLTQLGLLPVCDEERYFFWESRSYGGDGEEALPELAARWTAETFGILDAEPYVAVAADPVDLRDGLVAVSLGVGENPAKRVDGAFETRVLQYLSDRGVPVLVDEGAGGDEAERVRCAVESCPAGRIRTFRGSFASFARTIARSRLYVGYDSAGQHVAAACGIPLVTVFAGFANDRMLARWRPTGRGPVELVRADHPGFLEETLQAIARLV